MQNQNSSPFDWGNSLIGNIALIKDMIPQMQDHSTPTGWRPQLGDKEKNTITDIPLL